MGEKLLLEHLGPKRDECAESAVVRGEREGGVIELRDEGLQRLPSEQVDGGRPAVQGAAQDVGGHGDVADPQLVVDVFAAAAVCEATSPVVAVLLGLQGPSAIGLQAR